MVAHMVARWSGRPNTGHGHQRQMIPANDNAGPFAVSVTANSRAELMHAVTTLLRTLSPDAAPRDWIVQYDLADDVSLPCAHVRRRAR